MAVESDDVPPLVTLPINEVTDQRWTGSDVLGIITVFERMLLAMEARLVAKMDDNSQAAAERWARHDRELEASTARMEERFQKVEHNLLTVETLLEGHLQKDREEDLVSAARVAPVKTTFTWLWSHWRDLVLVAIGLIALVNAVRLDLGL